MRRGASPVPPSRRRGQRPSLRRYVRGRGASPSVRSGWKDPAGAASSSAQSSSSSSRWSASSPIAPSSRRPAS